MPRSPTISKFKRATAQRLRKNATDAEMLLWRQLKRLDMHGTHFRRQMPIGNYIVDFACPAARLIIEVDGSQHGENENRNRDEKRTRWLEAEGYRVVRVWNNDVTRNIEGVMEMIYAALYGVPQSEPRMLKHSRHRRANVEAVTPPRRASRADPPPPGEGKEKRK